MDRLSVIVRSRGTSSQLSLLPDEQGVELCSDKGLSGVFFFDAVLPVESSQSDLYDGHLRHILEDSLEGQVPVTILAYGQTGAGKTYTMGTNLVADDSRRGVMPRVIEQVFAGATSTLQVRASFYEIYNEQIFDLLLPRDGDRLPLLLKEDNYFHIPSLSSLSVASSGEALQVLSRGSENRSSGATDQNNASSRSHAVFSLLITQGRGKEFRINMVDLAGSECLKRTNATGRTLIEGLNINKSLLALGNVVEALSFRKSHIPFRDSVLTKILKECLISSGSYTVMIACISHKEMDLTDSVNTLRYAHRAKRIRKQASKQRYFQTPRKQNSSLLEGSKHPFKTPAQHGSFLSRTPWLTSTANKQHHNRQDISADLLSDASLISNVSECCAGVSPRLRRYKEEFERSIFTTINPLLKEIQDLKEQLCERKSSRKKPRMTSSPIGLNPANMESSSSSDDEDITIKPQSIKKRRKTALRDVTNEGTLNYNSKSSPKNDESLSIMEQKLGIYPDIPFLFEEPVKKVQTSRRRSVRLAEKGMTPMHVNRSCLKKDAPPMHHRRRSFRLQEKRQSTCGPLLVHPMQVKENWTVQSQQTHNDNVLGILNSGNLKVLQALPAVGPKSAMVIHTHRNLNGPLKCLTNLENIKGLAKYFYKKFLTQNQIVV